MERAMYGRVLRLAVPAIVSTMLLSFQMLVDVLMLGRYPPADISLSALGIGFVLYHVFTPIIMGLVTATVAVVARRWGEARYAEAGKVATDAFVTLTLISLPIAVLGVVFGGAFAVLMGAHGRLVVESWKYIGSIFAFYPFYTMVAVYHGMQRGAGDTRTPMYVDIVSNLYNVVMDYLLIFGAVGFPELGVGGAGIATGTSYVVASSLYLILQRAGRLRIGVDFSPSVRMRYQVQKSLFAIGIPAGLDRGMWAISSLMLTPIVLYFGTTTYSGYQIGLRAESIAYMPAIGISIAATTLSGQYLGAGSRTKAAKAINASAHLSIALMTIIGAVLILLPKNIAMVFTSDEGVSSIAAVYLFLMGISEPALGAFFAYTGGLRGAGYTRVPMIVNFLGLVGLRVALAWAMAFYLGMGVIGVWLALVIETFVRAGMIYAVFLKGGWADVRV